MLRILTPDDYRVMPWRNGGGTTTEIWIHPPGAGWDAFDWRVGIADIAQSGPFSSFPGIDRSIMLIERPAGSGMRLTIDGRDVELALHEFVDFDGNATTFGTLLAVPVRDFNVMSRRARVRHRCGVGQLARGATQRLAVAAWLFVHALGGGVSVQAGGAPAALRAGESLIADDGQGGTVAAPGGDATFVWAAFEPAP